MQHDTHWGAARRAEGSAKGVSQFAAEVVARLVARDAGTVSGLRGDIVEQLLGVVTSSDEAAFDLLKPDLRRARISASALADVYIPEIARRLGCAWEEDRMSFADVTIGVARLQAILREIGSTWTADGAGAASGATLLMILPPGEQHTLGAMVLMGRLRRSGVSVCLRLGPTLPELARLAATGGFRGALVSVAGEEKLESCNKVVKTLKDASNGRMRVAVGGAILFTQTDVLRATGADCATNDIDVALKILGVADDVMDATESLSL